MQVRRFLGPSGMLRCSATTRFVEDVDRYAKAKVLNFLKRVGLESNYAATVDEETSVAECSFRASLSMKLPSGEEVAAVGFAANAADAEVAASMHATCVIDAAGYQLFTLSSMQKKHAQAAAKDGRWATTEGDKPRKFSMPLPIAVRNSKLKLSQSVFCNGTLIGSAHGPVSVAALDSNALHRIRHWFERRGETFEAQLRVSVDEDVTVSLKLPNLNERAVGIGSSRTVATHLAAMHAEQLLAFHKLPLYTDDSLQMLHDAALDGSGFNREIMPLPARERRSGETVSDSESIRIARHWDAAKPCDATFLDVPPLDVSEMFERSCDASDILVHRDGSSCVATCLSGTSAFVGRARSAQVAVQLAQLHAVASVTNLFPEYSAAAALELTDTEQTNAPSAETNTSVVDRTDVDVAPAVAARQHTTAERDADGPLVLITSAELDGTSRARVLSFMKRKRLPFTCDFETSDMTITCRFALPLGSRPFAATGMASNKRDAEVAAFMHAERLIDASGSLMFNLPGLQRRHAERVSAAGRWAATSADSLRPDFTPPAPLRVGEGEFAAPPVPDFNESLDWSQYVTSCQQFIADLRVFEMNAGEGTELPLTNDIVVDTAYAALREEPTDKGAKARLMNYCNLMGLEYPVSWVSKSIGGLGNRRVLTEVAVPGFEHVKAAGVAPNKDDSQRRACMHCLQLLQVLDPDWKMFEEAEDIGKRRRDMGAFDRSQRSFTPEGKQRVIQLFTLCCALPPPTVDHRQRRVGSSLGYVTTVKVVDHAGQEFSGSFAEAGNKVNEPRAFSALYEKLMDSVPAFRALASIVRTHPHLDPDHVVSVNIPTEVAAEIESVSLMLNSVSEGECNVAAETSTRSLLDATASDPKKIARLSEYLRKRRSNKVSSDEYQSRFLERRESLAIFEHREEILNCVLNNQVTVLCGTTGCGKTTQIPQYILDAATDDGRGGEVQIVVTQPRRLNAVSIAQRIAAERLESVGDTVGYTIRLESHPGSSINFCTSGVLLRLLQSRPSLEGITHLIIDEIHERDLNSDFLLILVKDLIAHRPDLRVILMSATLQAERFQEFFGSSVPLVNVSGFAFPVQELYLEDVATVATEASFKSRWFEEPSSLVVTPEDRTSAHGLLEAAGDIDFDALGFAIVHAVKTDEGAGSLLVFLPGWDEIVRTRDMLATSELASTLHVLLLHSSVSIEDQSECFTPPPEGKVKVILATNIAESGVTIDDVSVVIDVGRAKEKSYITQRGRTTVGKHETSTMSRLVTVMASKANSTQRRGRAGRTRPGRVIRLYPKDQLASLFEFQTPEIHRTPLDSMCLQILALGLGSPLDFLQRALDPPAEAAVRSALGRLLDLGAVDEFGAITTLGRRLAMLPVAPQVAKMILLGAGLGCLDSVLTVASCFDADPFVGQRDLREVVKISREDFANGSQSDHITQLNAYNSWCNIRMEKSAKECDAWASESALSVQSLQQISRYKSQYRDILMNSGYLDPDQQRDLVGAIEGDVSVPVGQHAPVTWRSSVHGVPQRSVEVFADVSTASDAATDIGLVKGVLCSGLFPNVALFRDRRRLRNKLENVLHPQTASTIATLQEEDVSNPYFMYEELVKSDNRVLIRGVSNVSFWALVLLGTSTKTQVQFRDDLNLAIVDDWIVFRVDSETLESIYKLKGLLADAIERKFRDPRDEENNDRLAKLQGVVRTLVNQSMQPNDLTDRMWADAGTIVPLAAPPEQTREEEAPQPVAKVVVDPDRLDAEDLKPRVVGAPSGSS